MQSRTNQVRDIITKEDASDAAIIEPAALTERGTPAIIKSKSQIESKKEIRKLNIATLKVATVGDHGKVELADSDFKEFIRR